MCNLIKWPVAAVVVIFSLFLMLIPWGGLVFSLVLVISGTIVYLQYLEIAFFQNIAVVWYFLDLSLKVYWVIALLVFGISVTYRCLEESLFQEVRINILLNILPGLLVAIFWPAGVYLTDRHLRKTYQSWEEKVCDSVGWWIGFFLPIKEVRDL